MKKLFAAAIVILAVVAASARAQISLDVIEVLPDANGNFEQQRLAAGLNAIPVGFRSWQIEVTTNPGAKWIGAEVDLFLTEGTLHYNVAVGGNLGVNMPPTLELDPITNEPVIPIVVLDPGLDVKTGKSSPAAALYNGGPLFADLPFTTHFSSPGIDASGQRGSVLFTPDPIRAGDVNTTFTSDEIIASYIVSDLLFSSPGTHVIGMITLSDDAVGHVTIQAVDEDTVGEFDDGDPPVVIRPAAPAIFDGAIVGGAIVPEPSSLVLAIAAALGLFCRLGRRRARGK